MLVLYLDLSVRALRLRGLLRGLDSGFLRNMMACSHVGVFALQLIGLFRGSDSGGSIEEFSHVTAFALKLIKSASRFRSHRICF
jgi:hypothetical protein